MLTTRAVQFAGLMIILLLTALLPSAAQEQDPAARMVVAYTALQEQVQQQAWPVVAQHAQALLNAAAVMDPTSLTADQLYMVGVAHYWLMGLSMEGAIQGGGLTPERLDFARQMADLVFRGGQPEGIKVIGHGERVTLEEHLTPGMITIVDFFSEFCPPCMAIAPVLEKLIKARSDLALLKVDINRPGIEGIDWQSPVAEQFNLRSIPYFRVYDAEGKLMAEGQRAGEMIIRWVQEL